MTSAELEKWVEAVVQRVLERIADDPVLRKRLQPLPRQAKQQKRDGVQTNPKRLFVERDLLTLASDGVSELRIAKNAIVTPAAQDAAREKSIKIIRDA